MATYLFKTLEERKKVQQLYEDGLSCTQLAEVLGVNPGAVRRELLRGYQDEARLPDMRLKYDAELAQLRMQRSLERRGGRNYKKELSQWDGEE